MVNIIVLLLVGLMAMASSVNAAGFRLSEQDAKANGMGNSFVAVADNASAVWYNPAAMTELEKTNLSLGTVMVYPTMEHTNVSGTKDKIENTLHVPPYLYATHKLNEKWALGFGFNAPFGLSSEWDKTSATTKYVATLSDIKAFNYNLNGAYKVNDRLSFGLGIDYVSLDAKLYQMAAPTMEMQLSGTGHGWGYNAAAFYKLNEKWNFGASYRSPVKVLIDGTAKVTNTPKDNDANTKLTLPDTFQVGAGYKVNEKWLVSATADYTDWATYHALKINSATFTGGTTTAYKGWESVWGFHAGTEYKYSDTWKFRAGSFYDLNPVKEKYFETRVPDSDRLAFSIGAGYTKGNIVLDISYTYLMFMERTIHDSVQDLASNTLNGKYNSTAHLPAISVGYKF